MKKAAKIIVIVLVIVVVLLVAGVFALNSYLQRPEFKNYVLAKTQEQLAVPLEVQSLKASLFSGFELRGLVVKNPQGSQTPSLLSSEELVFRYRLWPLLRKKVEIETVSVEGVNVVLEKAEDGTWNYEKLTKEQPGAKPGEPKPAGGGTTGSAAQSAPSDLKFEIANLKLANANLLFLKPGGKKLVEVADLDVHSNVAGGGRSVAGKGALTIQRAAVIESIEARDVRSPVVVEQQQLKLTDVTGKVEDGTLKGTVVVDLQKEGYPYTVHAEVADVDLAKIGARFTDKAKYLSGKLHLKADVAGVGGDTDKLQGKGSAHVTNGTLAGIPLLQTIGTLLRISGFDRVQFDEIALEYTMDQGVIETPVIKLISKDVQITGNGKTDFDFNLNHQLTLALSPAIMNSVPKEVANVLAKREDGFRTLAFNVTGPYDAPKTNIPEQLAKGAAGSLIEKGLQELLGGEKKEKKKKNQ